MLTQHWHYGMSFLIPLERSGCHYWKLLRVATEILSAYYILCRCDKSCKLKALSTQLNHTNNAALRMPETSRIHPSPTHNTHTHSQSTFSHCMYVYELLLWTKHTWITRLVGRWYANTTGEAIYALSFSVYGRAQSDS